MNLLKSLLLHSILLLFLLIPAKLNTNKGKGNNKYNAEKSKFVNSSVSVEITYNKNIKKEPGKKLAKKKMH